MLNDKDGPHILVVDDDLEIRELLSKFLTQHNFRVTMAKNGKEMMQYATASNIDLIVLDIMLPGDDGFELCRKLRQTSQAPIIMVTAVSDEADRIVGLELGADDYVTKPFNPRELLARIKAVLRRVQENGDSYIVKSPEGPIKYQFSDWELDKNTRRLVSPEDMEVTLSAGEYDLLIAFLTHPQRVLNRDQLLDMAKNRAGIPFDRSIDVQVSRLRQKLEIDPKNPEMIKTVRGGGYMLTAEVKVSK
jgi:two-component system OmpR family response regulator